MPNSYVNIGIFQCYNKNMKLTEKDIKEIRDNADFVAWNRLQNRIAALQKEGITLKDVADIVGIPPRTLYRLLSTPQNYRSSQDTSRFFKYFGLIVTLQYMGRYLPKKKKRKYRHHNKKNKSL